MNILFELAEIQHLSSASVLSPLSEAIHPGCMRVAFTFWLHRTRHDICPKLYTTSFSAKNVTEKVRNLRHALTTKKRKCNKYQSIYYFVLTFQVSITCFVLCPGHIHIISDLQLAIKICWSEEATLNFHFLSAILRENESWAQSG